MFDQLSQEAIEDLQSNTTSRLIIRLVLLGGNEWLMSLKSRRADVREHIPVYEGSALAYFNAAKVVEQECWGSTDMSESFADIITSLNKENNLYETIRQLSDMIEHGKELGFYELATKER